MRSGSEQSIVSAPQRGVVIATEVRAEQKLAAEDPAVRDRVRLVQACGEDAAEATGGQRFTAVLCTAFSCTSTTPIR